MRLYERSEEEESEGECQCKMMVTVFCGRKWLKVFVQVR